MFHVIIKVFKKEQEIKNTIASLLSNLKKEMKTQVPI